MWLLHRSELLAGPLFYVIVLLAATLLSWRTSAIGLTALAMMCGGDGVADIVGRNIPGPKLPYNSEKSVYGTSAMLLGMPSYAGTTACMVLWSLQAMILIQLLSCRWTWHDCWIAAHFQEGRPPCPGPDRKSACSFRHSSACHNCGVPPHHALGGRQLFRALRCCSLSISASFMQLSAG